MYKAKDLAKFTKAELMPLLPAGYSINMNRTVLRRRANFVQFITLGTSRGGYISVSPVIYLVGADDKEIIMTCSGSIGIKKPNNWKFHPDTLLDHNFAQAIIERIEKESPISFLKPLEDAAMVNALKSFDQTDFAILSYIAFLYLSMGDASAKPYLSKLEKYYAKVCDSTKPSIHGIREWEYARQVRTKNLISRMSQPDCVALCRQEAEMHAELLGLPKITWPEEWPLKLSFLSEKRSVFKNLFTM